MSNRIVIGLGWPRTGRLGAQFAFLDAPPPTDGDASAVDCGVAAVAYPRNPKPWEGRV